MLAAVVAKIRANREREAQRRQDERHCGGPDQREQRSVCEWIAARLCLDVVPYRRGKHAERRPRQRRGHVGAPLRRDLEPHLVLARGSRSGGVDRRPQRDAVAHDGLAARSGEPLDDLRDPNRHGSASHLKRNHLADASGQLGQAWSHEHRGRRRVRRLWRPQPRRPLERQRDAHADALRCGTHDRAADADPVPKLRRERPEERNRGEEGDARVRASLDETRRRHDVEARQKRSRRSARAQHTRRARASLAELDPSERPVLEADDRGERHETRAHPELDPSVRERNATHLHRRVRLDEGRELGASSPRPPVVPPHSDSVDRRLVQAEHGDAADPLGSSRPAGHPQHRARCAALADELVEALERCGIEDANEVPEVLADDDVVRHLERSLLSIAAHERRPIPLREECDGERDGEERDRRDRSARPARQSDGRKPSRKSATPAVGPESRQRRKDPRDGECCGDRDEAGEQEQEKRRSLAARELLFVSGAADERHSDDEHRSRGNEVECSDPRALALRERHGDQRRERLRRRRPRPRGRVRPATGRSRPARRTTGAPASPATMPRDGDPRDPAENDAGDRNRAALDATEQPQLPPLRPEPGEPPSRGLEVAAHAARSEDREREQKRRAFPADEEEARAGDVRRALDRSQLVHGRLDRERRRALGQLDARTLGALHELVDVPEARACRGRWARPTRTCGTCARAPPPTRARCAPLRRRVAPAEVGGTRSSPRARVGRSRRQLPHRSRGGSRRRAGASAAFPCRPRRSGGPERSATLRGRASGAPRSGRACTCAADDPIAGSRARRRRRSP